MDDYCDDDNYCPPCDSSGETAVKQIVVGVAIAALAPVVERLLTRLADRWLSSLERDLSEPTEPQKGRKRTR